MTKFRIETVLDESSGYYSLEIYYPDTESLPLGKSDPIFTSHESAVQDAIKVMRDAFQR